MSRPARVIDLLADYQRARREVKDSGAARLLSSTQPPLRTAEYDLDDLDHLDDGSESMYDELRGYLLPANPERREAQFAAEEDEELYAAWATHARLPRRTA